MEIDIYTRALWRTVIHQFALLFKNPPTTAQGFYDYAQKMKAESEAAKGYFESYWKLNAAMRYTLLAAQKFATDGDYERALPLADEVMRMVKLLEDESATATMQDYVDTLKQDHEQFLKFNKNKAAYFGKTE